MLCVLHASTARHFAHLHPSQKAGLQLERAAPPWPSCVIGHARVTPGIIGERRDTIADPLSDPGNIPPTTQPLLHVCGLSGQAPDWHGCMHPLPIAPGDARHACTSTTSAWPSPRNTEPETLSEVNGPQWLSAWLHTGITCLHTRAGDSLSLLHARCPCLCTAQLLQATLWQGMSEGTPRARASLNASMKKQLGAALLTTHGGCHIDTHTRTCSHAQSKAEPIPKSASS